MTSHVGIWGSGPWRNDARAVEAADVCVELEELGFASIWLSAGFGAGLPDRFGSFLGATNHIEIATGILSIWHATPTATAASFADLEGQYPGRFTLGLGASHATLVEQLDVKYERPYSRMVHYLDELDSQPAPVPSNRRVLAALGPKMLALAAERAAGAHPYFVPVEHTAVARAALGPEPKLIPEQAVVLETDPERARTLARGHMASYLRLPNYTNNLRRFGYEDDDFRLGGSDRLVDAIVVWGEPSVVRARVDAHMSEGADQVLVQVITENVDEFPRDDYRTLAASLIG